MFDKTRPRSVLRSSHEGPENAQENVENNVSWKIELVATEDD